MNRVWLRKMTISLPLLTCDTKMKLYATRNSLWYRSKLCGSSHVGWCTAKNSRVCNNTIHLRYYCKWGKIHHTQHCWEWFRGRDMLASDISEGCLQVYYVYRVLEYLFRESLSPKYTCLELRPGAGFCGQFVATLWFPDTWQETREHVDSTDSDHLLGSSECRRAYLFISVGFMSLFGNGHPTRFHATQPTATV